MSTSYRRSPNQTRLHCRFAKKSLLLSFCLCLPALAVPKGETEKERGRKNTARSIRAGRARAPILRMCFSAAWLTAQFGDRLSGFDDEARAASVVEIGHVARDVHVAENRRGEVARGDGTFFDLAAVSFG